MPPTILGSRSDQWAIDNPPTGNVWKCWTCHFGNVQNVGTFTWTGWPICGEGWYFAGPFLSVAEANAYFWDGVNPCEGANSTMGGGSGGAGSASGGGARFFFPHPPTLKLDYGNYGVENNPPSTFGRDTCCGPYPIYINGQPGSGTVNYTQPPPSPPPPPDSPPPSSNYVATPCCEFAPANLIVILSNGIDTCACLDGEITTITYNGDYWEGTLTNLSCPSGTSVGVVLRCFESGTWGMMIGGTEASAVEATCVPFYLQFQFGFPPLGTICSSSVTAEVIEDTNPGIALRYSPIKYFMI